jgi:hypothetical protein
MAKSLRALLAGAIDYAGLFPPAGLSMAEAVRNYAGYRAGSHAWALGRFIVPAERLDEFSAAFSSHSLGHSSTELWRLSVLAGKAEIPGVIATAHAFNQRHSRNALVDTVEFKTATRSSIEEASLLLDRRFVHFHEVPMSGPADSALSPTGMSALRGLLDVISRAGSRAKIRTGGVTAEAFPEPAALARFLEQSAVASVPFKATAGLHHPIRGQYPLTYEAHSPVATMHGFVNLALSAAFARAGWSAGQLTEVLAEPSPSAFRFESHSASWRGHHLPHEALRVCRAEFLISFGSCSFEEPIEELRTAGWLPE